MPVTESRGWNVQTGNVHIEMIDLWGNKSILSSIAPGQIFAETYAICRKPAAS